MAMLGGDWNEFSTVHKSCHAQERKLLKEQMDVENKNRYLATKVAEVKAIVKQIRELWQVPKDSLKGTDKEFTRKVLIDRLAELLDLIESIE